MRGREICLHHTAVASRAASFFRCSPEGPRACQAARANPRKGRPAHALNARRCASASNDPAIPEDAMAQTQMGGQSSYERERRGPTGRP